MRLKWNSFLQAALVHLSFALCFVENCSSTCSHFSPDKNDVIYDVEVERDVRHKRSTEKIIPLRIRVEYDRSLDDLPAVKVTLIKTRLIPSSVAFLKRTLAARQPVKRIHLYRQCSTPEVIYTPSKSSGHYCWKDCAAVTKCGHNELPDSHLLECRYCNGAETQCGTKGTRGSGFLDTDFVLYVSTVQSDRCKLPDTVAYAAYCQLEAETDRPLAGYVNVCPTDDSLSDAAHYYSSLLSTVKHEILHALGFSAGLFAFYRNDDGVPLTPRSPIDNKPHYNDSLHLHQWSSEIIKTYVKDWRSSEGVFKRHFDFIVTPRVVREVRKHFECPELEGAELENQGGHGTELTHLEKRVFGNEAMTGTYTHNPVFSRITLALMEDTGWYIANYSNAETFTWGKGLGCLFVQHSCFEYGLDEKPFCVEVGDGDSSMTRTRCTEPDRGAVGICNLKAFDDRIPAHYRYFKDYEKLGGSVVLADYCPFVQDFNWRKSGVIIRGSTCDVEENNPEPDKNIALETYGSKSTCLDQYKPWDSLQCTKIRHSTHWGSGCYRVECLPTYPPFGGKSSINVVVDIHNRSFHCAYPRQKLNVRVMRDGWLHVGFLSCPESCRFICTDHPDYRPDNDPEWCYKKDSNFLALGFSTDSLQCKARFSYLCEPLLLFLNLLVIILLSSNVCIYL